MSEFEGKVALVTGGAQGLGQAICQRLAREGCDVVVTDIKIEQAQATAEQIAQETGRRALAVRMDVADEASVQAGFDQLMATFGRLDILVSNAGILIAEEVAESDANKWRAVMNVNLFGYYLTARAATRIMKPAGRGVIIQINSKSGKKGSFKNSAYAASKFGGIGFTQSLALELAEYGVRVNAVCPGNLLEGTLWQQSLFDQYARNQGLTVEQVRQKYIDQVPMKRGCTYDDVCNVVVFLASDQSSYMTGQAINVTGGQEMR
ncbi:MAG: Sorbitol-6-phosphate 2-dehydrogenase [Chloroflexi bacterium ADurb.Bin325]|nr:MAG: Sorbitol-6-phosphate 2-dehydrogenase [Chloroflexi bacterium ADurb.Bin325]